jgi:ATP-dependent protease HslVU (ClpYQ) peptidase subunit
MTCIIGLKQDSKVYIGGDSAALSGYDKRTRKDKKVFRNGKFVFGFTTSFRMGQLLQYKFKPPEITQIDLFEYMATDFVDALKKCFKDNGYSKVENNIEEGGIFLVGINDRLFKIESDFQVAETIYDFDACGCGEGAAMGAMFATGHIKNPQERILKVLNIVELLSAGVSAPFFIESVG